MRRAEKAERIAKILDRLHPLPRVPLQHESPFQLLVAVVLSAQCTDERVNQVTPGLFALAPSCEAMAELPVARIRARIQSCGLAPAKAKHLRALSRRLVEEHGGRVPADLDALEALPGVGHKTASVVMVQAFGRPAFPVDTHIHRLAARWGLSSGRNVVQAERDLWRPCAEDAWGRVHLERLPVGSGHCPARGLGPVPWLVGGGVEAGRRKAAERRPTRARAARAGSRTRGRRTAASRPRRG